MATHASDGIERCATALVRTMEIMRRYPNSAVARQKVCAELGVKPRQAIRYIRGVRLLWKLQGTADTEQYKREAEAVLLGLFDTAMSRTRTVVVDGECEQVDDPDVKAATAVYWRLIQLRGLDPAIKLEVSAATPAPRRLDATIIDADDIQRRLGAPLHVLEGGKSK